MGCLKSQIFMKRPRLMHVAFLVERRGQSLCLTTFPLDISYGTENFFSLQRKEEKGFTKMDILEAAPYSIFSNFVRHLDSIYIIYTIYIVNTIILVCII